MRSALVLLVAAVLLGACATPADDPRLTVGASSLEQARALYGKPSRVWPEPDGGHTLEYTGQPYGTHCYMLRFDAAGKLLSRRDGLARAERARVVPGMTIEQVQRLLGRERTREHFARSDEEVWDWNVEPNFAATWLRFTVYFRGGVVDKTVEIVVDPDRRRGAF